MLSYYKRFFPLKVTLVSCLERVEEYFEILPPFQKRQSRKLEKMLY
jgi:hypothetical protein